MLTLALKDDVKDQTVALLPPSLLFDLLFSSSFFFLVCSLSGGSILCFFLSQLSSLSPRDQVRSRLASMSTRQRETFSLLLPQEQFDYLDTASLAYKTAKTMADKYDAHMCTSILFLLFQHCSQLCSSILIIDVVQKINASPFCFWRNRQVLGRCH